MANGIEEEIVRISSMLGTNPGLIDKEVKYLIEEYEEISNIIRKMRDKVLSLDPRIYLYPKERAGWLSDAFKYLIRDATNLCLRERKLKASSSFKRFVDILDRDVIEGLTLFKGELEVNVSKNETQKGFENFIMKPFLKALLELKHEIENEKIRAEIAKKAIS